MSRPQRRGPASRQGFDPLELRRLLSGAQIFVRFVDGVGPARQAALIRSIGGEVVRSYDDGPTLVSLPEGAKPAYTAWQLSKHPAVAYAERDRRIVVEAVPNDRDFGSQWGLDQANNIDIDATQAWSITTGNPATIVAVIDSGIDADHPEFAGRLWTNPNEVAGGRVDADGNGLHGDVHGWNFLTNTADIDDDNGHGTHVAGILAATGDNRIGVAGVDWNAQIMALKMIDSTGGGSIDAAVRAVRYAVDHGARVINASWSGTFYSRPLADAIRYAASRNVVVVAAAGNAEYSTASNNDRLPHYPSNIRQPNVLSVAAVNERGQLASYSNYGATTVTLAAPGSNILSTKPGRYGYLSGTSMATPYVSGVASLVIGQNPGWNAPKVVRRITQTVKPIRALNGKVATGGIVDAYYALTGRIRGDSQRRGGIR